MVDKEGIFKKHKAMFERNGCTLLEVEYKSTTLKWAFICICGNLYGMQPANFKRGNRCPKCSRQKQREGQIIKDNEIEETFKNRDEVLLDIIREFDDNKNVLTYVKYKCVNNHTIYKHFTLFRVGHKCKECGIKTRAESNTKGKEFVIEELKQFNCKYVDGYIDTQKPFYYYCFCGKKHYATLSSIRKGGGCGCKRGNLRGEKHHNYKEYLTECDRKKSRNGTLGYASWRRNVIARDHNSCVVCWDIETKLVVHHLNSFSVHKDERVDLDNGVTLCKNCHKDFHAQYGKENVSKNDFKDFIYCKKNYITW